MKRASFGPTIQSKPDFCPTCDGRRIIKRGLRKNCFRRLQIYSCKDCGGYFVSLVGLKGVKYPPRVIARTLCLWLANCYFAHDSSGFPFPATILRWAICSFCSQSSACHCARRSSALSFVISCQL
jgi:hypothetical protein